MTKSHRQLDRLLTAHGRELHALLLRLTLRPDAAEDLMQDLFLNLARSEGFPKAANPAAYAFQTAINLAMTWRRNSRRHPPMAPITADPLSHDTSTLHRLIDAETIDRILDALDDLPEEPRRIVVLRFIQEQTYESIARQIDKDPHTTRALCHKAIRRLRLALNPEEEVRNASD